MNRILSLAALSGIALLGASSAQAQNPVSLQAANFTLSGGDPLYSIASDVTFTNLVLTENFANGTSVTDPLIGANGLPAAALNTTDIFAQTNTFFDNSRGGLTFATLTGGFNTTGISLVTSFGAAPVSAAILPTFSATLNVPSLALGSIVNINAVDASTGAPYAAGTFAITAGSVPEPGSAALLAACGIGLLPFLRRRAR